MKELLSTLKAFFLCSLFFASSSQAVVSWETRVSLELEQLLKSEPQYFSEIDNTFFGNYYRDRDYELLWVGEDGLLNRANELLHAIENAEDEGLNSSDYYIKDIRKYLDVKIPSDQARLELLLSAAFYKYSNHAYSGRYDPGLVEKSWHITNRHVDSQKLLERVSGNDSIKNILEIIPPQHAGYQKLKAYLKEYIKILKQGGWQRVAAGPELKPGVQDKQVVQLRRRLVATGDLDKRYCCHVDIYDGPLASAVKRYQARHGLIVDGNVGPQTRASLNKSLRKKIAQIRINMERWRWMPRDLGERYIMVNMSGYELYMVDDGKQVLEMPVIVGREYRSTPSFAGFISYMEYNPFWTIPKKLVFQDFAPKQAKDASYFSRRAIKVFKGWESPEEIDPGTVDWSQINWDKFPYWLRQDPGPTNALGRIKFMFSNPYRIYLHGTPQKHLFNRVNRAFSSGCIRVRDPMTLAVHLLDGGSSNTKQELMTEIQKGNSETVNITNVVPIYLVYWTAWVDEKGKMNFRDDIYKRDKQITKLFKG